MDEQCELTLLDGQACPLPAFRDTDLCFWHAVWYRTLKQYRKRPDLIVRSIQLLAAALFFMTMYGVWRFSRTGEIIWLPLSTFFFGSALRFFAESIMGLVHPFSQSRVWPKFLASGLVLQMFGAMMTIVIILLLPHTDQALVNLWNNHQWRVITAQRSLVLIGTIAVSVALSAFERRILGHAYSRGNGLVWVLVGAVLLNISTPDFLDHPLQSRLLNKEFWEAAIASNVWFVMLLSYLTSLSVVSKNCGRMLRRRLLLHDARISGEAIAQSYLAYFHIPFLATVATRYFMVWMRLNSSFLFLLLSVVLAFVFGNLITLWILRRALWHEALVEGQEVPVMVKADYEFSSEWSRVLKDFGRASRRLRAATYELVRRADPDPSIDRLVTAERTNLMVKEAIQAIKSEIHVGRSVSSSARAELRKMLNKLESDVRSAEEEIVKWREQIRGFEGEGRDRLPAGISIVIPVPNTVNEKMLIKKAQIIQIKDVLAFGQ